MAGYIKLHRDIQQHWLFAEKRVFSRYEAWIDILLRVNHTTKKISQNGKPELVERGSAIWSMGDMEQRWGWSNRKVKRFLDCLVDDQMLTYKSTTKKTYLTVVNYEKYQGSDSEEAPPMHHGSISNAFQKHTNKNEKNDKEKDINPYRLLDENKFPFMTPILQDKVDSLIEEYGLEDFVEAVEEAVIRGKRNLPYVTRILENWRLKGKERQSSNQANKSSSGGRRADEDKSFVPPEPPPMF